MNWLVIEHYPEGTKWTHSFATKRAAEYALEGLKAAHGGRRYQLVNTDENGES